MSWFVFRNNTVERFFDHNYQFSGYTDVSFVPQDAEGYIWFYTQPLQTEQGRVADEVRAYCQNLQYVLTQIPAGKPLIILTMVSLYAPAITEKDNVLLQAIADYNQFIQSLAAEDSSRPLYVLDFSDFTRRYAQTDLIDWKFYFLTQIGLNPRLAADFKQWFARKLDAIALKRKKCLVLDLDNTLWGGVLGEDGIDGIQCSGDYPGKAFHWWQEALLELSKAGVILAICSKNNLHDVEELWAKNPNLVLRKEHFAAWRINWQDKATNLQELAAELNIGLDSFVFVDDNPTERELIRQVLPMVSVPDFPAQPYDLPLLYNTLVENYFKVYALTAEDQQKTAQYRANAERKQLEASFTNFDDYLRSLNIELTIAPANDFSIPRIAQMTQKTNQFNLTTRRYTEADIRRLLADGALIYTLSVKDRFGDNGITGLIIIQRFKDLTIQGFKDSTIQRLGIDTLLMSCRVLGKGIEMAFINCVLSLLRKQGAEIVEADYYPTLKNQQVADFYDRFGFTFIGETDGNRHYELKLAEVDLTPNNLYQINLHS